MPALAQHVFVPPGVVEELSAGLARGINLPSLTDLDWVTVRTPTSAPVLPLVTDLGAEIAETVVGTGKGWLTELSRSELKELFALRRETVAG